MSDDERREVARRLREKKAECEERGFPWMCDDLILALGYDHDYEAGDEIFDRLADLIDPCDTSLSCRDAVAYDRDALLAVAETLEDCAGRGSDLTALGYSCLAKRIREACGEEDG